MQSELDQRLPHDLEKQLAEELEEKLEHRAHAKEAKTTTLVVLASGWRRCAESALRDRIEPLGDAARRRAVRVIRVSR